jgi:hypothetical protein
MTEQVKRYHRSVLGFFYQQQDGDFVSNTDYLLLEKELVETKQQQETASNNAKYYCEELMKTEAKDLDKLLLLDKKKEELAKANKTIFMYRCAMIFMIVVGVVVEVIGAYYG